LPGSFHGITTVAGIKALRAREARVLGELHALYLRAKLSAFRASN
jgi:hypothetical protein